MNITIRNSFLLPAFLCFIWNCTPSIDFFSEADKFMHQYVSYGLVDYQAIHDTPESLNLLVNEIANFDTKNTDSKTLKAFYINTYNLLVIDQIVNNYPLSSPMDIDGFFAQTKYKVGGNELTLNQLEDEIIRPQLIDPRIHFALVCGAQGCAPLPNFAFKPNNADSVLTAQAHKVLNDGSFVIVDNENKTVAVSEIFKWYENDFIENGQSIIQYINTFLEEKIAEDYQLNFYPYDWKTNAKN